ncbi:hypothetical protein BXT86_04810, partial [candidate division WOR-3 bacterium 4484_100]
PLDTLSTIISIASTVFFIGLSYIFITKPFGWIFVLLFFSILIICYLLSPKEYYFREGKFIIEKIYGKKIIIPLDMIEEYVFIPNIMKLKMLRTFGNGGLFGYYGMFSTVEYGQINLQLTSMKNVFIIKTKKGLYAVSPEATKDFETYLKNAVTATTGEISELKRREGKIEYARLTILLIPLIIFLLTIGMILILYQNLPLKIAVHFDIYGNPDRWGPRTVFLSSNLIPSAMVFVLNIFLFLVVRRVSTKPYIPNFLVVFFSIIQLFITYVSIDTYWRNIHQTHIISIFWAIIVFIVIMGILLLYYYKKIIKSSTT